MPHRRSAVLLLASSLSIGIAHRADRLRRSTPAAAAAVAAAFLPAPSPIAAIASRSPRRLVSSSSFFFGTGRLRRPAGRPRPSRHPRTAGESVVAPPSPKDSVTAAAVADPLSRSAMSDPEASAAAAAVENGPALEGETSLSASAAAAAAAATGDKYANASRSGEIPTYDGDEKSRATDYANYFCSYAQLYHQKQMLADHNRMAAYHAAIMGNAEVFKDKVVMDVGTGSGILAVWAAKAGARRVYAVEYTDMAKHARSVMEANGVADVVTVIQGAVEDIELPAEEHLLEAEEDAPPTAVVDIMISEWMGYFLLRESMLDSLVRARDRFLKPRTGLMLPSHASMYVAPVRDEEERKMGAAEYAGAMGDWAEFVDSTRAMYGVDMGVLESDFEREQREYYLLSSRWSELGPEQVLCEPAVVKEYDMMTCTIEDARGLDVAEEGGGGSGADDRAGAGAGAGDGGAPCGKFDFDVDADSAVGPISGLAGWFSVDFKSRTDELGLLHAPPLPVPAHLSTAPDNGYTHWGQQTFHFPSAVPLIHGETTRIQGTVELTRTKENLRLYNARMRYRTSRRKTGADKERGVLMRGKLVESVYQIP